MNLIGTSLSRKAVGLTAIATIIFAFTATSGKSLAANEPAEQVVFSGIGVADEGFVSRFGFWVWCAAEGNGPYAEGNACAGSIYLYRLGITVGVHGFMTEEADETYTMHVFSNHPDVLSATLHNVSADLNPGPNNTVEFDVTSVAGVSSGESTNSVVVVTGPAN